MKEDIDRLSNDNSVATSSLSDQLEEMKNEYNKIRAKVEERESEINRLNNLLDKNSTTLAATNKELEGILSYISIIIFSSSLSLLFSFYVYIYIYMYMIP